ncbi:hypothetical protein [Glutamicibacter sp. JL.03c]|uniref:hypothetical protein n=1 Tax=Glutamicibacter sp. JL.03c TaxID=2984842 RepID=UPI0039B0AF36
MLRFEKYAAILVSDVVWPLSHASLILLARSVPLAPVWGSARDVRRACILFRAFLGRIRICSHSIWQAGLAHGMFNAR